MKFQTKQAIVKLTLLLLAVWPLLHILVVRSTGISPWRGFGWGMYTVPVLKVAVGVRYLEGEPGGSTPEGEEQLLQAMKHYMKRYQALGKHAHPDTVAASAFSAYPGFKTIEVNVQQPALDRQTARIVGGAKVQFIYRRTPGNKSVLVNPGGTR